MRTFSGNCPTPQSTFTVQDQRGFTLIEVLAALAILAIAFTAVLRANLQVQDSILSSRLQTAATLLASDLLARVESKGVSRWSRYSGRKKQSELAFSWRVRIERTAAEGLSRVRVEVRQREEENVLARREAFFRRDSGE
ncbi:MAG: type II secretion system minor pseudopilin GspI [Desulfohalobiaceae bacterium]|nr:type II secretion system minor pseudopilin GspI [Desulfohalobiaceae bacterium]